jgi:vitamin B12 transporter
MVLAAYRPASAAILFIAVVLLSLFRAHAAAAQAEPAPGAGDPASDVVITAFRSEQTLARAGSAITVITADEIQKAGAKSLTDVLRPVPGLDIHESGGTGSMTNVTLRGSNPGQTLVLIDGIRVGDAAATDGAIDLSALSVTDIERIEVLRGPQSALYGSDAMGGVINIITRKGQGPVTRTLSLEGGSYGTLDSRASVSGSTDRLSYSLAVDALHSDGFPRYGYRIGRLQGQLPPMPKGDATDKGGITGRLSYRISDEVTLEAGGGAYGNRIEFDNPFAADPANIYSNYNRSREYLDLFYGRAMVDSLGGRLRQSLTVFGSLTNRGVAETESCPDLTTNCFTRYRGTRLGAEYQADLKLGPLGTLIVGARTERETASNAQQAAGLGWQPFFPGVSASQVTNSLFVLHQLAVNDRLYVSLGGRLDSIEGAQAFSTWRATAAFNIFETGTKLRASAGTGAKAPSLYQRFSQYGDPNLQAEQNFGVDAGIDQEALQGRLTLSATAFYTNYRNLIDFRFYGCPPAEPQGCYYNVGRARTYGGEFSADYSLLPNAWRAKLTYTYLVARDLVTDQPLLQRPRNKASLSLIYTGLANLEAEARLTLVDYRYDYGPVRLAPYARLDLFAAYRLTDNFSVFARLENVTNAKYQEVNNYGTAGRSIYGGVKMTW